MPVAPNALHHPRAPSPASLRWLAIVPLVAFVIAAVAGSFGGPQGPLEASVALLPRWISSGWPVVLYLLAAAGMGRIWGPLVRTAADSAPLRIALGFGTLLAVSHLLGVSGLLGSSDRAHSSLVAWGTVVVPAVVELWFVWRAIRSFTPSATHVIAAAPFMLAGIPFALACNPPGALWASEFGAYDALSYHLALPQQWLQAGRIGPIETNVYSFLPSYFEAAFTHLGAMLGPGTPSAAGEHWLTAGDGQGVIACQLLHTATLVMAVWIIGRLARACLPEATPARPAEIVVAAVRGLLFLTPWSIVVGTLAYNEWPMIGLGAAALMAAGDRTLGPSRRAVLTAFLVGSACGVKPTAIQFFAPAAALLALCSLPPRQWLPFAAVGAVAGLVTIAPWLIRNQVATGNALFPFAPTLLGVGHWSLDQHARFHAAHTFDGSLVARLRLLVFPDHTDPAGSRHRGLLHPQYGFILGVGVAAAVATFVPRHRHLRLHAAVLVLMLLAWLFTTHLQSRFLMPSLVPATVLIAGVLAGLLTWLPRLFAWFIAGGLLVAQSGFLVHTLKSEEGGTPNRFLWSGPGLFTGEALASRVDGGLDSYLRTVFESGVPGELTSNLDPALKINGHHGRTLLIGDATPLYYADAFATTVWDSSPLTAALAASPGDPDAWTAAVAAGGFDFAMINFSELARVQASGYADPRLTPEAVAAWARRSTVPLRSGGNRLLVRLVVPGTPAPGGPR